MNEPVDTNGREAVDDRPRHCTAIPRAVQKAAVYDGAPAYDTCVDVYTVILVTDGQDIADR